MVTKFSCKQTKILFTFRVSPQNSQCISLTLNERVEGISFLLKRFQCWFLEELETLTVVFFPAFVGVSLHFLPH